MSTLKAAFLFEPVTLPIEKILPSRKLPPGIKATPRYKVVESSVREVGIIEPRIVHPQKGKAGAYVLLDSYVRIEILREMGQSEVTCLVSTDDENLMYNEHVSRITPIQEHRMIMKAIDAGVSEDRIAKALNANPRTIKEGKTKLNGISPDAIELLKDKPISLAAFQILKKVKP